MVGVVGGAVLLLCSFVRLIVAVVSRCLVVGCLVGGLVWLGGVVSGCWILCGGWFFRLGGSGCWFVGCILVVCCIVGGGVGHILCWWGCGVVVCFSLLVGLYVWLYCCYVFLSRIVSG